MTNLALDDIEIIVKDISANDGILLCNWNNLIGGGKCSCDCCPIAFNVSGCLGEYLYRRLK